MRGKLVPALLLLAFWSAPAKAGVLDPFFPILDNLYNATCKPLMGASVSIAGALDLGSFCRTYQTLSRFRNFDEYLRALAEGRLQNLPSFLIDAALMGISQGLGNNPDYQAFKSQFDSFMNNLNEIADEAFNAPARFLDDAFNAVYGAVYKLAADAVSGKTYTPPQISVESDLNSALGNSTPVSPELQQEFGYPDSAATARQAQDYKELSKAITQTVQESAKAQDKSRDMVEAEQKARKAAEEARSQAEARYYEGLVKKQSEITKEIADAAVAATVDDGLSKGIAPKLKEEAKNAPSDRRLLELQVEAIASLIDQQAIYASKTAELLAEASKAQLLATYQIAQEVRQARLEAQQAQNTLTSGDLLAKVFESELKSSIEASNTAIEIVKAGCLFYTGGNGTACQ